MIAHQGENINLSMQMSLKQRQFARFVAPVSAFGVLSLRVQTRGLKPRHFSGTPNGPGRIAAQTELKVDSLHWALNLVLCAICATMKKV
jgi:hypothetical protein